MRVHSVVSHKFLSIESFIESYMDVLKYDSFLFTTYTVVNMKEKYIHTLKIH